MRRAGEIEDLLREAAPRVLAAVVRRFGDFSDSEDAVQEAMIDAARQWPAQGVPENPVGWLVHVASRRITDRIRSDSARRGREEAVSGDRAEPQPGPDRDDTLVLMFMCCHAALTPASAIALTLRAVGGLTTAEIGDAFLVPEATMAQRIGRAKQAIKASPEPFAMPGEAEREERLRSVLRTVYLIFNEGYVASSGAELALIPLERQDRTLWDRELIAEGLALLAQALRHGAVGEYQLQAAIAAEHAKAPRVEDTDWREILGLYGLLDQITANPMVALNRAIAAAITACTRSAPTCWN